MPRRRGPAVSRPLAGQFALVTGAGIRVGRAIALALGEAGANVAVHHRGSARDAAAVVRQLRALGVEAETFQADLRQAAEVTQLVQSVLAWAKPARSRTLGLDILVNSAAGFGRRPLAAIDDEAWDAMLALNLTAPFRLIRGLAPALARRTGVIVNILDVAAFHAWPGFAHYCAAKAGLAMLTRCLAVELAPAVRVCGVAPGTVLFPPDYDQSARRRVVEKIPLGRVGSPEDVARAVLFLAQNRYVTGATIPVDGGRLAGARGLL